MCNDQSINRRHRWHWKMLAVLLLILLCGSVYAQPANNSCATAKVIENNPPFDGPYTDSVDATDATPAPPDPQLSCNTDNGDGPQTVWWEYTPEKSGTIMITTAGSTESDGQSELDTAHGAFVGGCDALVEVACRDFGLNDYLVMEVEAGETYKIKVGQYDGGDDAGTVVINVEDPILPGLQVIESAADGYLPSLAAVVTPALTAASASANLRVPFKFSPREVPNFSREEGFGASVDSKGPVGSLVEVKGKQKFADPATLLNIFDGGNIDENFFALGFDGLIAPPDPIGEVGVSHYIQMTNLLTIIFDKSGTPVLPAFPTSAFFAGLGGNCETSDDGDPIVLYDEETGRWLVSQFLSSFQDGLCIAVSETGDPTGGWYQYEFDFNGIGFPDYPKYGFATGAVSVMVNLFSPFQGPALGAIDKEELMSLGSATMVLFTGGVDANLIWGWVPGDNDGPVFDDTLPTFFTNLGGSGDTIYVAEVTPDWNTPTNSELDIVAAVPVTPWDSDLCDAPRGACIDQPGSGTVVGDYFVDRLEDIADRLMHRGQMRDDGIRKTTMLSHTVDVDGSGKAGVRWYELRNHKNRGWKLFKENTFSPDGDHRWMSSVAMNAAGQTCLGYSISSDTTYPSIGVAGRNGRAVLMNVPELLAYDGNPAGAVQKETARWGDYSGMSIDPVDDSCWYTQEYARPSFVIDFFIDDGEVFGWGTKIMQFTVPEED